MSRTSSPDRPAPSGAGGPAWSHVALTSFVGRERELASLRGLFGISTRLVTLTGSGGSGKTRLAQELAFAVSSAYGGGVHWVELAPLLDGGLVAEQVAEVVGVKTPRGGAGYDAIADRIGDERVLLALDNCEHVVQSVSNLVTVLLARCRHLDVLATSREALSVPGETAWLVPSLSLPIAGAQLSAEAIEHSEAVRLFVQRAREVLPSFRITDANAADVAAICRRLDGMPLALELAAARMRSLGPAQLLERLDDRFRVLTARGRAPLPRHRTLRAAIDWSYDLLSSEEQLLLDRLSTFSGSFDLVAVENICAGSGVAEEDVLDLVSGLVEKSLVEVLEHGSYVRYRLLESVRGYASERLLTGGEQEDMNRRHADYFAGVVATAEPHFTVPGRRRWIARLSADNDNLRQALAWLRDVDPTGYLQLVGKLCWYWFGTEHWSEGRRWIEGALSLPEASQRTDERAAALFALGVLTTLQGQAAVGRPALEESWTISAETGDSSRVAYARLYLGLSLAADGRPEAVPNLEAARSTFSERGDLYGGRLALLCLGAAAAARGELDAAAELTQAGLDAARAFGQDRELAVSLRQLAMVELRRGASDRAVALAGEALDCLVRDPQHYFIAMSLEALASGLADRGRLIEAVRLFGAGEGIRETIGVAVAGIDAPVYEPRIAAARRALGEATFADAWAAGRDLSVGAAVALGREGAVADSSPPTVPTDESAAGVAPAPPDAPSPKPMEGPAAEDTVPSPAGSQAGLVVRALGPLEITLDGRTLEAGDWSHLRPRELLLNLLCHPGGRTRQEVGEALWPGSSPAQVKNSFHVALHHLRKTLGRPEWVRLEEERYRVAWEFGVSFDVADFSKAVKVALREARQHPDGLQGLREALSSYRGDFLAEEAVGDWCLAHRDDLRSAYVEGLVVLAELLLELGADEEAVEVGSRVVLLDDLHEEACRQLMTAYARTGKRVLAIRQFERLATILREELSAEPEPETLDLQRRILAAESV